MDMMCGVEESSNGSSARLDLLSRFVLFGIKKKRKFDKIYVISVGSTNNMSFLHCYNHF